MSEPNTYGHFEETHTSRPAPFGNGQPSVQLGGQTRARGVAIKWQPPRTSAPPVFDHAYPEEVIEAVVRRITHLNNNNLCSQESQQALYHLVEAQRLLKHTSLGRGAP